MKNGLMNGSGKIIKEKIYVDFITNTFSLADLLLALENSHINDFAIISQENEYL